MTSIIIKSEEEIQIMRESGAILANTLEEVIKRAKPGVSTLELDEFAEEFIRSRGGAPAFKGYQGFPCTLCTSINEEIVHTIPSKTTILKEGDLFTADCGVLLKGFNTDAARSTGVGQVSPARQKLMDTANRALSAAIDIAQPGNRVGQISETIQKIVEGAGYHIIRDLTGHGIGRGLHEEPIVPNFWDGHPGPTLQPGMTIAIEPIFAIGTSQMRTLKDDWTIVTADGSDSVQQENTILITPNGNEILTRQNE